MPATTVDHRPDLRLALVLGVVLLGSSAGLVGWVLQVRDRLPDPVARHWGMSGAADGFSSLTSTLWVSVGLLLLTAGPLALVAVLSRQPAMLRRTMAATAAWLGVFLNAVFADSLRGQLDLLDPSAAAAPGVGIGLGTVIGLIVAIGVAAVVRPDAGSARATMPPPASALRITAEDTDLTWRSGSASLDRGAAIVAVIAVVGLALMAALLSWWLLPLALLVALPLVGLGRITATIDGGGLSVQILGLRLVRVPIADIAEADVVHVDPLWEFGGWGLRTDVHGRTGVVTRKGPALRVRRGDASEVLVTIDDTERAAAILNSLADRRLAEDV